jgi:hypothetical protein
MATYLDCINGVLRRIRETEAITPTDTSYVKLIGDFVNEAKREIEDSWNWSVLRTTKTITSVNGTQNYAITGSNPRSKLLVVYIPSVKKDLTQASQNQMHSWVNNQGSVSGIPQYFSIGNSSTSGEITLDFWPIPEQVYSIKVDCVVPQNELSNAADVMF